MKAKSHPLFTRAGMPIYVWACIYNYSLENDSRCQTVRHHETSTIHTYVCSPKPAGGTLWLGTDELNDRQDVVTTNTWLHIRMSDVLEGKHTYIRTCTYINVQLLLACFVPCVVLMYVN